MPTMNLTQALRDHAVAELGVAKDAADADFEAAVKTAIAEDRLTVEKYVELAASKDDPRTELDKLLDEKQAPIVTAVGQLTDMVGKLADQMEKTETQKPEAGVVGDDDDDEEAIERAGDRAGDNALKWADLGGDGMNAEPAKIVRQGGQGGQGRVKRAIEQYDHTRTAAVCPEFTRKSLQRDNPMRHPLAGQAVKHDGRILNMPSQADLAMLGAFFKWQINGAAGHVLRSMGVPPMSDHEKCLLHHAFDKEHWCGGGDHEKGWSGRLTDRQKATVLINDTTSGGQYAVPRAFDDMLVIEPVLHSELAPRVNMRTLPQGNVVDGATLGALSVSAQTEGSAVTLLTTDGLIGNLDTTIFACSGQIQIGLDLLADTPINLAQEIIKLYGEYHQEWLDNQIANGDGTTQPEGILTASGTTSVSHGSTASAMTVSDFEQLLFAVPKATRDARGGRVAFVSNERSYRRARKIPTATNYETRAQGMDYRRYHLIDFDAAIETHIADGTYALCNFGFYNMWRRLGAQVITSTEGVTLIKANSMVILVRTRYGGRLGLATACAKMTDGVLTG